MHEGRTDGWSERIARATAALYRVTALLPATEPLRTILREYANRVFVEHIERAHGGSGGGVGDETAIETLCGFLAVARSLPDVRPENFSVLEREYRAFALARSPEAQRGADNAGQGGYPAPQNRARAENASAALKKTRLSAPARPIASLEHVWKPSFVAKASSRERDVPAESSAYRAIRRGRAVGRRSRARALAAEYGASRHALDGIRAAGERQRAILELLTKTPQAKASDFYAMLQGVSPKTIQRDLQDLVAQNVIKRAGDRRWTVYSRPDVR